jgi:hypothetical protein
LSSPRLNPLVRSPITSTELPWVDASKSAFMETDEVAMRALTLNLTGLRGRRA